MALSVCLEEQSGDGKYTHRIFISFGAFEWLLNLQFRSICFRKTRTPCMVWCCVGGAGRGEWIRSEAFNHLDLPAKASMGCYNLSLKAVELGFKVLCVFFRAAEINGHKLGGLK
jgi:hypothetical protein